MQSAKHGNDRQMVYTHTHTQTRMEKKNLTVLWNQAVHTDTEVTENRSDIIIKHKKGKTCILIEVAIPTDRNVFQNEAEKKLNVRVYV
jgi:hypothetical protein